MTTFNNVGKHASWFPIKQFRFNTEQHPCIKDKAKRSSRLSKLLISRREEQMLEGLSNILQCSENDAIRIAVSEALRSPEKTLALAFDYGSSSTTEHGFQSRTVSIQVSFTSTERKALKSAANRLKVTEKALVRTAIHYLCRGIRGETITTLDGGNIKAIAQHKLAKQWKDSRTKEDKERGSKLTALKQARQVAYDKAEEEGKIRDEENYIRRGEAARDMTALGLGNLAFPNDGSGIKRMDTSAVDEFIAQQAEDNYQKALSDAATDEERYQAKLDYFLSMTDWDKEAALELMEADAEVAAEEEEDDDDELLPSYEELQEQLGLTALPVRAITEEELEARYSSLHNPISGKTPDELRASVKEQLGDSFTIYFGDVD